MLTSVPTGRRIVLLHGLAGSRKNWGTLPERLGPHVQVLAGDLPWSSSGPVDWAQEPDAPGRSLRSALQPGDLVVAHSFAANLMLEHLATRSYPEPAAVLLVSPFYQAAPEEFTWDMMAHFMLEFDQILQEGLRVASVRPVEDELLADMARRVRDKIGPYGWIRFFDSYLTTATLSLKAIDLPIHIVHGGLDTAAPPYGSRLLAGALPRNCRVELNELETSGHFPMVDQPDAFREVVERLWLSCAQTTSQLREAIA